VTSNRPTIAGDFSSAPILSHDDHDAPSVFTAENLLREARRQKALPGTLIPAICVLDPDGDLVDYLRASGRAQKSSAWACYHTDLYTFMLEGSEYGVVGRVVGASFAVLVAEELFASGCRLLISITSAGQIIPVGAPPYFVLIERALRDEGTSYHYLPPTPYTELWPELREAIHTGWNQSYLPLYFGATWTTDAPFRETESMIARCRAAGIFAVEMEAAALYALGTAKNLDIVCFAHVTNQMAQHGVDFEKGDDNGSHAALQLMRETAQLWRQWRAGQGSAFDGNLEND
jgi:uridine phosphorylase